MKLSRVRRCVGAHKPKQNGRKRGGQGRYAKGFIITKLSSKGAFEGFQKTGTMRETSWNSFLGTTQSLALNKGSVPETSRTLEMDTQ